MNVNSDIGIPPRHQPLASAATPNFCHSSIWLRRNAPRSAAAHFLAAAIVSVYVLNISTVSASQLVRDQYGTIIRGDQRTKKLALVFTGDEYGESLAPILDALKPRKITAAFFVTGNFLRQPVLLSLLKRAVAQGHYVGPHSNSHPLYASWDDRGKSLVSEEFFRNDLRRNIADLRQNGLLTASGAIFFIPPYEQCNRDQVRWARKVGVTMINFTPGSGSNRDYAKESDSRFVSSQKIYDDILAYERKDPHGLNGFVLLLHLGSGRKDPFHARLGPLCDELRKRDYDFERVDQLLR
ncbi:MAG TPA: polysaccharide deacetylase family protein [Lacipirellulaceae bacterium]|nr:polysaccharide deacetylase family protein [Lacipirellulaceae bacterium]